MKIYLIRHGRTKGNIEKRYVGITDEGLMEGEQDALEQLKAKMSKELSNLEEIYVSPLRRCVETGYILFPEARQILVEGFRECNFGDFEYKNHEELLDNSMYLQWLETGGEITFPGGESKESFQHRVVESFLGLARKIYFDVSFCDEENREKTLVMVVHGGTIMSILDRFSVPHKDYFDWQVENGQGFVGDLSFNDGEFIIANLVKL